MIDILFYISLALFALAAILSLKWLVTTYIGAILLGVDDYDEPF